MSSEFYLCHPALRTEAYEVFYPVVCLAFFFSWVKRLEYIKLSIVIHVGLKLRMGSALCLHHLRIFMVKCLSTGITVLVTSSVAECRRSRHCFFPEFLNIYWKLYKAVSIISHPITCGHTASLLIPPSTYNICKSHYFYKSAGVQCPAEFLIVTKYYIS